MYYPQVNGITPTVVKPPKEEKVMDGKMKWDEQCGVVPAYDSAIMTNADRIRAMTDEELANQLAAEQYVGIRTFLLGFDKELLEDLDEEIKMAWPESVKEKLNWLKREAET